MSFMLRPIFTCSHMDLEQYEEAVRDYEKICKMERNNGMRFNFCFLTHQLIRVGEIR